MQLKVKWEEENGVLKKRQHNIVVAARFGIDKPYLMRSHDILLH